MISNYRSILENHFLLDLSSVNRALHSFNKWLDEDRNKRTYMCNRLITDLHCKPVNHPVDAEIFAKALIEQVILNGDDFDPEKATVAANARVEKIKAKMPELYSGIEVEVVGDESVFVKTSKKAKRVGRATTDVNDKKEKARAIWEANRGKPGGDIARLIAAELKITYANAYYYVSRVFK